jgi:nucleotide-binding universal stress UspA family protein
MYKNILIATDGSELANKGVRQGLALAEKLGAKVTFLSVVAPLAPEAIRAAMASGIADPIGGYDQQIDEGMKKR